MSQFANNFTDAQALTFVQGQAYKINTTVYEERFPDWDFARLVFVDTSGPEWSPGVMTYTSTMTGAAQWQSGYAKDVPMADVGQAMQLSTFHLAAVGYQYNIEEVNTALGVVGGTLPNRRARAARQAYQKFMYDITVRGNTEKGKTGLINAAGVTPVAATNDGTSSARWWINNLGVITKSPAQIMRDINQALMGVNYQTNSIEYADTILLPPRAIQVLASTVVPDTGGLTILAFISTTNVYTVSTGRPLTIRAELSLETASTETVVGGGRLVAYKNDPGYVKLNLPMPHRFLPVYQDGPLNFAVPGIFRTGGIELLTTATFYYLDGVTEPPA